MHIRRLARWLAALLISAIFAPITASAYYAHSAVREGALVAPIYSCIERVHSDRLEKLADRALARAIQKHYWDRGRSSEWHLLGLAAYVGSHTLWSAEQREALVLMNLKSTPLCKER